ncbi:MAG: carboxylesterase [Candidatus Aminicenantes bacterium]|nr:carboxylesterase [Candidatus Aminicenantes bacterium]
MKRLVFILIAAAIFVSISGGRAIEREYRLGGRLVPGPLPPNPYLDKPPLDLQTDVLYYHADVQKQRFDFAKPSVCRDQKVPLVIYIHGGGWSSGDKGGIFDRGDTKMLFQLGFAVASVNYRLAPQSRWPAPVHDCKLAVRFFRRYADLYGIDPDRIGVFGDSAGGHLAALLATADDDDGLEGPGLAGTSSRVAVAVERFGPTDLLDEGSVTTSDGLSMVLGLLGCHPQQCPAAAAQASPVTYVTPDDPPILIQHGDKDSLVPYRQAERLAERLRSAGNAGALIKVRNAEHAFIPSPITAALGPSVETVAFMTVAHLARTLEPGAWGDLNLSGRRNGLDVAELGKRLGEAGIAFPSLPAPDSWNPLADLVLDGVVDARDLSAFFQIRR